MKDDEPTGLDATSPWEIGILWLEQAERAAWRQYDAAAECCAVQTLIRPAAITRAARIPPVTRRTRAMIDADPEAFWARVDEHMRILGAAALAEHWS